MAIDNSRYSKSSTPDGFAVYDGETDTGVRVVVVPGKGGGMRPSYKGIAFPTLTAAIEAYEAERD